MSKPAKPYRRGKFLLSERCKKKGRFVQMKFGRRLLMEVRIGRDLPFQETEAFLTLKVQADEYHQRGWVPKPKLKGARVPKLETADLFDITPAKSPIPLEDLF